MVRTVVEREPEWDDEQYRYAIALHEWEASLDEHGFPLDEVTSPLADPDNRHGEWTYVVDPPTPNYADRALEEMQKRPEYSGENFKRSRRWSVRKVLRAEAIPAADETDESAT